MRPFTVHEAVFMYAERQCGWEKVVCTYMHIYRISLIIFSFVLFLPQSSIFWVQFHLFNKLIGRCTGSMRVQRHCSVIIIILITTAATTTAIIIIIYVKRLTVIMLVRCQLSTNIKRSFIIFKCTQKVHNRFSCYQQAEGEHTRDLFRPATAEGAW